MGWIGLVGFFFFWLLAVSNPGSSIFRQTYLTPHTISPLYLFLSVTHSLSRSSIQNTYTGLSHSTRPASPADRPADLQTNTRAQILPLLWPVFLSTRRAGNTHHSPARQPFLTDDPIRRAHSSVGIQQTWHRAVELSKHTRAFHP